METTGVGEFQRDVVAGVSKIVCVVVCLVGVRNVLAVVFVIANSVVILVPARSDAQATIARLPVALDFTVSLNPRKLSRVGCHYCGVAGKSVDQTFVPPLVSRPSDSFTKSFELLED